MSKEFLKKIIIKNKFFNYIYVDILYLITIPCYLFKYKIANPKIDKSCIDKVIFIAHPDDEILSLGNFLQSKSNLLVICMTNGGNIKRLNEFRKSMNKLNSQYQIWNFKDAINYKWNTKRASKKIKYILNLKENWNMVITHNEEGDYGHYQHKQVYKLVKGNYRGDKFYCPILKNKLFNDENKLSRKESEKKKKLFSEIYKSQLHILDFYNEYFNYEKIVKKG